MDKNSIRKRPIKLFLIFFIFLISIVSVSFVTARFSNDPSDYIVWDMMENATSGYSDSWTSGLGTNVRDAVDFTQGLSSTDLEGYIYLNEASLDNNLRMEFDWQLSGEDALFYALGECNE